MNSLVLAPINYTSRLTSNTTISNITNKSKMSDSPQKRSVDDVAAPEVVEASKRYAFMTIDILTEIGHDKADDDD